MYKQTDYMNTYVPMIFANAGLKGNPNYSYSSSPPLVHLPNLGFSFQPVPLASAIDLFTLLPDSKQIYKLWTDTSRELQLLGFLLTDPLLLRELREMALHCYNTRF
jgi:hypothetical protein